MHERVRNISGSDSGSGSLRQAIADANATSANDEIIFASSLFTNGASTTITLGSALPDIKSESLAGALTITGQGAASLIISGDNGNINRNFSIFNIDGQTTRFMGGNLAISGVTVSGARTSGCGGAFNNSGSLTVTNSTISGNKASYGGGIDNYGSLTVTNSALFGNKANYGGGIDNYGSLTVTNSTLSGNTATFGGGIVNAAAGTFTVSNSTISNNSAKYGGGIRTDDTLTVSSSTLSNNKATTGGGGIENNLGTLTITNSTLFGNTANQDGGGILNIATLNLRNSTIVGNSANNGGGISNIGMLNIANTIIGNSTSGSDYTGNGKVNLIGSSTAANNLVTQSGLTPWATAATSAQLNLGPLQNNGGPTFTMALGGSSVAIAAGNAIISRALPVSGLDQRGFNRITSDIGAFNNTAPTLTTILPLTGATEDTPFSITYAALVAASDVSDAEGDLISFRIESVNSGTLTKNGVAVVARTTLLSRPNPSLDCSSI